MEKILFITGTALLVIAIVLCYSFVISHNKIEITFEKAIENAKNMLNEKNIETITNYDNPKIEEIVFDTQPSMYYFDNKTDVGKSLYKITFNTTQDGLLGPIVFYVDKSSGAVIGAGYRE